MVVATLTKKVIFLRGKIWHNVDMKLGRAPSEQAGGLLAEPYDLKRKGVYYEMSYH